MDNGWQKFLEETIEDGKELRKSLRESKDKYREDVVGPLYDLWTIYYEQCVECGGVK